jgi:ankyrin repeat protein
MDLQDVQALDKAGNSALHYAAISGASHAHLKILIEAGVPIYEQNTANETFLHCLRRRDAGTESDSLDCYQHGLVSLLESIDLKKIFGQQDNNGRTILHTFASHIMEPQLREATFM